MFSNVGWIVEAKIKEGKHAQFETVVQEIVAATGKEAGTLNYQYYVANSGHVMVYERFKDVESAHFHVDNWDRFAERWIAAAEPTRMVHLGDLPADLRERHAGLGPLWLQPFAGFERSNPNPTIA